MTKTDSFWDWAEKKLDELDLSWYRVEKISGLANATISKRARERLPPTETTCEAIARAFEMPKIAVLEHAGKLPQQRWDDPQIQQLLFLFDSLMPEDQERLLIIMHSFKAARDKGGDNTTA